MKKKNKKIIWVGVCLLALMALPVIVEARDDYTTYSIDVKDEYEYVGMTPERIYTKSNMKVPKDLMASSWDYDSYFIAIWTKIGDYWIFVDDETYYDGDFDMLAQGYRKKWYHTTKYWKFTGDIDFDPGFHFQNTGKHRVNIEIIGSVTYWDWNFDFWTEDFRIYGTSGSFTVEAG